MRVRVRVRARVSAIMLGVECRARVTDRGRVEAYGNEGRGRVTRVQFPLD